MKLLLINPNISDSVSALIRAEAQRSASPGTSIEVLTAPFGVAYIETRMEAVIGGGAAQCLPARRAIFDRRDFAPHHRVVPGDRGPPRPRCPARQHPQLDVAAG